MNLSIFDLFSIGIGPSSSHTVGPMKAANLFATHLANDGIIFNTNKIRVELYGSLGFTGKAHGSEKAILMGLEGENPEDIEIERIDRRIKEIISNDKIKVLNKHPIPYDHQCDLIFNRIETLPLHSNGMKFQAFQDHNLLSEKIYYSVGGGFINTFDESETLQNTPPHAFGTGKKLLEICNSKKLNISNLVWENECHWQTDTEIKKKILKIWEAMNSSIEQGCSTPGILPGGLKVKRRAPEIYQKLNSNTVMEDPLKIMDWVSLYAIAVNEQNAAGGRVVTAPTNGAAGIIPAVIKYYLTFCKGTPEGVIKFLLVATAIGILFKKNASISGAEVGCQGEVGVACSMAAAGLTEVMGGTPEQVENAAEIGMEHNLGLTCDPIGGLVQVPCIERNAMGAIKAINASRLALQGDGTHFVSLDKVIKTMKTTGEDMKDIYKETSRGGLAVNVTEC